MFIFAENNYLVRQYICPHHVDWNTFAPSELGSRCLVFLSLSLSLSLSLYIYIYIYIYISTRSAFSLHSPYILVPKPRREDPPQLGSSHKPTSGGPPPLDLAEKLRQALGRGSPLALLDWHPHTSPHCIHWLQGWVKSHFLGSSLSLAPFPSTSARREDTHGPWVLSLVPRLTLK